LSDLGTQGHQAQQESSSRQRILESAGDEFAKYGLAGARVDRIAEEAGVNKAMLYYHFHSKEKLYEDVVEEFFRQIAGRIRIHMSREGSLEEMLQGIADAHAQMVADTPKIIPILLRELAEPHGDLLDSVANTIWSEGMIESSRERIDEAMQSGECRHLDVRQMIISFVAMSLGYHLLAPLADRVWNVTDRKAFIEERRKGIVDLFLYGVKVR